MDPAAGPRLAEELGDAVGERLGQVLRVHARRRLLSFVGVSIDVSILDSNPVMSPPLTGMGVSDVTVVWIVVEIIPPRLKEPAYRLYEMRLRQELAQSRIRLPTPHRGAVRRQPAVGPRRGPRRRQLRLPRRRRQDRRDAALVPGDRRRDGDRVPAVDREPATRRRRTVLADRDHHRRRRGDLRARQPVERAHRRRSRVARRGAGPPAARRRGFDERLRPRGPSTSTSRSATADGRRSPTPCARCSARNSPTARRPSS